MAQQRRLTLKEVEELLDQYETENMHTDRYQKADLFRLAVTLDKFLVKHDRADLARQLRSAVRKAM